MLFNVLIIFARARRDPCADCDPCARCARCGRFLGRRRVRNLLGNNNFKILVLD